MPEETCPWAYDRAIEAAGGWDNLTNRELQLIDMGVRAGIQSAQDLLAEKLRERA